MVGECSICNEILDNSHSQVRLITCDHVFHIVCLIRWFEKLPEQRNTCPHCLSSMSVNNLRIIQFNSNRSLDINTNTKTKVKRLELTKCGFEFNSIQSIVIANLEHGMAELQAESQRLDEDKVRLEKEKQHLIEEEKRLDEEKKRLDEEKKRLDEEKKRLEEESVRLEAEMRRLEDRLRLLEEQLYNEMVVIFMLFLILFIGFGYCLKYEFRSIFM